MRFKKFQILCNRVIESLKKKDREKHFFQNYQNNGIGTSFSVFII